MEMAVDAQGRMLALRGRLCHDHGACTPYGVALAYNAGTNVIGPYVLPAYRLDINWCLTNFVPCAPTRGAGRPQGMYVMERLLDAVASEARHRARRGAAAQHDPAVADALCDADQAARRLDHDLRQRRLSGVPAPRARRAAAGRISRRGRKRRGKTAATSASASPTTSRAPAAARSKARRFASARPARSSSRPARARRARAPRRCWRSLPATCSACAPEDIDVIAGDTAGTRARASAPSPAARR